MESKLNALLTMVIEEGPVLFQITSKLTVQALRKGKTCKGNVCKGKE
jgi:hypothetical protein